MIIGHLPLLDFSGRFDERNMRRRKTGFESVTQGQRPNWPEYDSSRTESDFSRIKCFHAKSGADFSTEYYLARGIHESPAMSAEGAPTIDDHANALSPPLLADNYPEFSNGPR